MKGQKPDNTPILSEKGKTEKFLSIFVKNSAIKNEGKNSQGEEIVETAQFKQIKKYF